MDLEYHNGLGLVMTVPSVHKAIQAKMEFSYGVMVEKIETATFSKKIGLEEGDIIIKINNCLIMKMNDLRKCTAELSQGMDVNILIYRNGIPKNLSGKYDVTPIIYDELSELHENSCRKYVDKKIINYNKRNSITQQGDAPEPKTP